MLLFLLISLHFARTYYYSHVGDIAHGVAVAHRLPQHYALHRVCRHLLEHHLLKLIESTEARPFPGAVLIGEFHIYDATLEFLILTYEIGGDAQIAIGIVLIVSYSHRYVVAGSGIAVLRREIQWTVVSPTCCGHIGKFAIRRMLRRTSAQAYHYRCKEAT